MPRANPPQTLRKLALGNAAGDRAVQPGIHTTPAHTGVRIAATESPDVAAPEGYGAICGSPDGSTTVDLGTLDPADRWPYAWTVRGRNDSTYPGTPTPTHPGVTSWSVVDEIQVAGTGTDRWLLTLFVADGGSGGSGTMGAIAGSPGGSVISGLGVNIVPDGAYPFSSYIEPFQINDADGSFVDPVGNFPDCDSSNDSADFYAFIKMESQLPNLDTPINVTTGTGSGAAPTIPQDAPEAWTAMRILMLSGYGVLFCAYPYETIPDTPPASGYSPTDGEDFSGAAGGTAYLSHIINVPHMNYPPL